MTTSRGRMSPRNPIGRYARRSVLAVLTLVCASVAPAILHARSEAQADGLAEAVVVFLVRHAERAEDGTRNPPISAAGHARARAVAALLADAGITRVHSTDYLRTRQTSAPTLEATGLPLRIYDPSDLGGFADALSVEPGRHLVVGHSDTTPALVASLGGTPGPAIEHMEYDRLYVVTLSPDGSVTTVLLRFGAPYAPDA